LKKAILLALAGFGAGAINGLLGAGGGMVLVPILTLFPFMDSQEIFPTSVCIILPICIVSILSTQKTGVPLETIIIYMIASAFGGLLAGILGNKIPTIWLHRLLGILILWGGIQYIC
jgi:uncharacterized membrane protein YfcA